MRRKKPTDSARKRLSQIIGVCVSAGILYLLYSRLEPDRLIGIFSRIRPLYCLLILASFGALYLLAAWRWRIMVSPLRMSLLECFKVVAASGSLSIVVPAKLGSFSKVYFTNCINGIDIRRGVSAVIYEKLSDLAAMSLIFILGCLINNRYNVVIAVAMVLSVFFLICFALLHAVNLFEKPPFTRLSQFRGIGRFIEYLKIVHLFKKDPGIGTRHILRIIFLTLFLWIIHTTQIIFFFHALNLKLPLSLITTNMFCAIFVGLIPVSFAGIGTRDLAIVHLFNGLITYSEALSIGLLSTLRYIVPTLFGIPFLIHLSLRKTEISASGQFPAAGCEHEPCR